MAREVELRSSRELTEIARRLRAMDNPELKKRFGRELRAAAKPIVPEVRAAIRQVPSSRPYSASGLRGRMVKAVKLEARTTGRDAGVRIRVDGRKMPNQQKALQSYMEGVRKPWRHPVFGNREVWVKQDPKPYFYDTVNRLGPGVRQDVNRVLDGITRDIT